MSFNPPLVVEERPLLQAQVDYLGFFCALVSHLASCFAGKRGASNIATTIVAQEGKLFRRCARVMSSCHFPDCIEAGLSSASSMPLAGLFCRKACRLNCK